MGRRKDLVVPDAVRRRIQTSKLIDRLQEHIFGKLELSMSRIRAIEVLLRKTLPDLVSATVTADLTVRYVAELPPMLSITEWEKKYSVNHLDQPLTIEGTVNGGGNGRTEDLH